MRKTFLSLVLVLATLLSLTTVSFAVSNDVPTSTASEPLAEVSVTVPADINPSIENGNVIYYNFYDPSSGYHYNFYNETDQSYFRWRKDFTETATPRNGEITPREEDGTLHVYWTYEFYRISNPVDGSDWGNTFVIDGPAALISGDAYIYHYYTQENDYDDTSAKYKIQVKKDGVINTTAFSRTCYSNTSYFDNFTPNAGSTYYVVVTPQVLDANDRLCGSGRIYTYR